MAERAKTDLRAAMRQQLYTKPSGLAAELLTTHLADADRLLAPSTARLLRFILGMPRPADAEEPLPAQAVISVAAPTERARQPKRLRWLRRR